MHLLPSQFLAPGPPSQLLAITAQSIEVDDGDAAIFESQQAFLLQRLQTLIGLLPGDAGQRTDFLLGDLEMKRQVRIENRVEQRRDAAGETGGRIQRATVFEQPDEL